MKPVTIDKIHPENHIRWIEDQKKLDPRLIQEAALVPPHSEVVGSVALYKSQLVQLFELHKCNLPWATFTPPPRNAMVNKRFFSPRLFFSHRSMPESKVEKKKEQERADQELFFYPELDLHLIYDDQKGARWASKEKDSKQQQHHHEEGREEKEEVELEAAFVELKSKVAQLRPLPHHTPLLFEKEKSALFNLMEALEWINGLLRQIYAKKIQYQKG